MNTYRMEIRATICFDVEADSETVATEKAENAITDYIWGYNLEDGENYSDVQLYADDDQKASVLDIHPRPFNLAEEVKS